MKVVWHFAISDKLSGYITVSSDVLRKIEKIYPNPGKNPNLIGIKLPEDSPELKEILKIIREETGLVPQQTSNYNEEEGVFRCLRWREYDKRDYDEVEFLQVFCEKDVEVFCGRENGETGRFILDFSENRKTPPKFGKMEPVIPVVTVAEALKLQIDEYDVAGLKWLQTIKKSAGSIAAPDYWQLYSEVVMPPLLNELRTCDAQNWSSERLCGDPVTWEGVVKNRGCYFVDGPYTPVEPHFRRSEVRALGEFDVARMRELVGLSYKQATHPIIISQRFRKILKKLKVSDKNFVPVRLVD